MTGTPFTWDARSQRYRDANGRFVSRRAVRAALDTTLENTGKRMQSLGVELRDGKIDLDRWYDGMRSAVKDVHLYSTAAAKGGWDQMTQRDFGRVGRLLQDQYAYLDRFAADIASGRLALDGRFLHRIGMYAQSGRRTYYRAIEIAATDGGADLERSVLHPADHCDDCVIQAALGWQKRGEMIPIGERQCLSSCKCTAEYMRSETLETWA